jgi:hypothetical protein
MMMMMIYEKIFYILLSRMALIETGFHAVYAKSAETERV